MPASSCTGPLRRREFLRVGTLALGGWGLADLLGRPGRRASDRPRHLGHPVLDVGRPEPVRDLRPQARRPRRVSRPVPRHRDHRAGPGPLRALPAAGRARRQDRPGPLAAPHDVGAQRRLDRGAHRQDARPARPDLDGPVRAPRFRHGGQPGAGSPARRHAALRRHPQAAVHDPADVPGRGPFGLRHRRPVGPGLPPAGPDARRRRRWPAAGGPSGPARTVRRPPSRPGASRGRRRGRPVPRGGLPDAHQPEGGRGLRPVA